MSLIDKAPVLRSKLFWMLFCLPNLLAFLYFTLIATPQYVSEASVVVYQSQEAGGNSVNLRLSETGGGLSLEGDYLLAEFLTSWDCFSHEDAGHLRQAWSAGDFISHYGGIREVFRDTPTLLWHYFQRHVTTRVDEQSAIMKVRVRGYDADFVHDLNQRLLLGANQAINAMNREAYDNAEHFFRDELEQDQRQLRDNINQLSEFQRRTHLLDPNAAYGSQLDLLRSLAEKRATVAAQADVLAQDMPNSPERADLQKQLDALDHEMAGIETDGHGRIGDLTKVSGDFVYLQAQVKNSQDAIASDEEQLLKARQTALQHQYFIEFVSQPTRPVNPTEPRRALMIALILIGTFLLYVIVK